MQSNPNSWSKQDASSSYPSKAIKLTHTLTQHISWDTNHLKTLKKFKTNFKHCQIH